MSQIGVETAQHVKLNYRPAGVFERILAYIIDFLVLGIYWLVLVWLASFGEDVASTEPVEGKEWIGVLIIMLPVMLYHLVMEILWNGYTVGKWFVGIRVVRIDGTRPSLSNYLIRWLLRLFEITMTSGVIAFFTLLLNDKGQRLGDIAAKTCVIKVKNNTKFNSTVFEDLKDDYDPVYPQVIELADYEISIINDVVKSRNDYDKAAWLQMIAKTRVHIQNKIGVQNIDSGDVAFLKQVIKDYNAIHGKIE